MGWPRFPRPQWSLTSGALRRLRTGPAKPPKPSPRPNGEAESPRPGAERLSKLADFEFQRRVRQQRFKKKSQHRYEKPKAHGLEPPTSSSSFLNEMYFIFSVTSFRNFLSK